MEYDITLNKFVIEFNSITGQEPVFDNEYLNELKKLIDYLQTKKLRPIEEREREFLGQVNWKFRLNANALQIFYSRTAKIGYVFHYHHKKKIQKAYDTADKELFETVLKEKGIPESLQNELMELFKPAEKQITLQHLRNECVDPQKLRIEKGNRNITGEIIKAQFSAFMWSCLPEIDMHRFFDPQFQEETYKEEFWEQLHQRSPQLFNRENAAHVIRLNHVTNKLSNTYNDYRNNITELIKSTYNKINNYGYLAIIIDIDKSKHWSEWELAADIILYSEKHIEQKLTKAYFKWEKIKEETTQYIPDIDCSQAKFEFSNEGFTYKDCFVIGSNNSGVIQTLILVFQKNQRDETLIPCPRCRSNKVQGNSYSSLGVRSWECNNLLCPERSKYNRGKRYSFRGLAMQQAIDDDDNIIPVASVRRWSRDVVENVTSDDIIEMLIRHYSMNGDTIHVHSIDDLPSEILGRKIKRHEFALTNKNSTFWTSSLFRRYIVRREKTHQKGQNLGDKHFQVILGDSSEILRTFGNNVFDGAVTSPPYYNAREYAQWPNIYCYLNDMYDINNEVFRTLKPGALYYYNVFDYFDNEKTIVFSAMGQKRMILSAFTVDLFRRIGFEILGNIVWDKGDIEGKRGFNAGNFSPYYQAPFNCWEHVLVFRKPEDHSETIGNNQQQYNFILKKQPVMKMVKGKNIHGHTAPYPEAIPELLIRNLKSGSTVLDPFGGSLTTGRVAEKYGINSVCIERNKEYCNLGLKMRQEQKTNTIKEDAKQLMLFTA